MNKLRELRDREAMLDKELYNAADANEIFRLYKELEKVRRMMCEIQTYNSIVGV